MDIVRKKRANLAYALEVEARSAHDWVPTRLASNVDGFPGEELFGFMNPREPELTRSSCSLGIPYGGALRGTSKSQAEWTVAKARSAGVPSPLDVAVAAEALATDSIKAEAMMRYRIGGVVSQNSRPGGSYEDMRHKARPTLEELVHDTHYTSASQTLAESAAYAREREAVAWSKVGAGTYYDHPAVTGADAPPFVDRMAGLHGVSYCNPMKGVQRQGGGFGTAPRYLGAGGLPSYGLSYGKYAGLPDPTNRRGNHSTHLPNAGYSAETLKIYG